MIPNNKNIVVCSNAKLLKGIKKSDCLALEYDSDRSNQNVKIQLNHFVDSVYHLPNRIKDLLEIAGYIFAADRKITRGPHDSVEYQSWSRSFKFFIPVRDHQFWKRKDVKNSLSDVLKFMTGDESYEFDFQKRQTDDIPSNFFDNEKFILDLEKPNSIILFSGGLDSLAGVIERLETTNDDICLISHQSGQPAVKNTQRKLFEALNQRYNGRCKHYKFKCGLTRKHAADETQRTRSFLFTSIAFAIANAFSQNDIYIYENGITSVNFPKRQDLMNARASRTTHPKTIGLLEKFLNLLDLKKVRLHHPFLFNTKSDIVSIIKKYNQQDLIDSTVSCSKTFSNTSQSTHCGRCSQCVDRRFAMYATESENYDESGIYNFDFLKEPLSDGETRTAIIDYIRLAEKFSKLNIQSFYFDMMNELADIENFITGKDEEEKTEKIYDLCKKHATQIELSLNRMNNKWNKPFQALPTDSFFEIISNRDYLKPPEYLLAESLGSRLKDSIPKAFFHKKPDNENELNDHVESLISQYRDHYEREFPGIKFSISKSVPDHSFSDIKLVIESKYIRGNNPPSKITEGIASDLTKYKGKFILFLVYDPERKISDDEKFKKDIETNENSRVFTIR